MRCSRSSALNGLLYLTSALVLFGGGFAVSKTYGIELRVRKTAGFDPASAYTPRYRRETGPQLVMIYFGSSGCAASNQPALPEAVEALKIRLAGFAEQQEMSFVSIGVALDWIPERGIEHLRKFGRFDEISAGYNWGNTLGLRYMWSKESVTPTTPQVVVYRRLFIAPVDSAGLPYYGESGLELLGAASGAGRIVEWAQSGSALPAPETSLDRN